MAGWIRKRIRRIFQMTEHDEGKIFSGSKENFMANGRWLLAESIFLFDGKTNPIRCLSVGELDTIVVDFSCVFCEESYAKWFKGVWEGEAVLIKVFKCGNLLSASEFTCRDIVVSTQMGTHSNVLKLLACCLETKPPVLVYKDAENGSLNDRILGDKTQNDQTIQWKDRIRIAWEISHTIAYLHTGFPRPIIHRNLKPGNVFLDGDNAAKLSDFTLTVSIPEGKKYLETGPVMGTRGYVAPEYLIEMRLAEYADVYSFSVLLLALLTGKDPCNLIEVHDGTKTLVEWVREGLKDERISEIVDPAMTGNRETVIENFQQQLRESAKLALRCTSTEAENRPTMIEVATQLKSIISSSDPFPGSNSRG